MKFAHWLVLGCIPAVLACSSDLDTDSETTAQVDQAAACPKVVPNSLNIDRSLWVRDAQILGKFQLQRVLTQIRTSSGASQPLNNAVLFTKWMDTFNSDSNGRFIDVQHCNDVSQTFGVECPRPEGQLAFLSSGGLPFRPVAIINRFDLAPQTGANCGEYRIVFAKDQALAPNGRMFIIFEATLPNPTPSAGIAGCLPVARFWSDLTRDNDLTSRQIKLENFYFTGTAIPGFPPVVHAKHFGLFTPGGTPGDGQIRTNNFISPSTWNLREYKLMTDGVTISVQPVENGTNPARHAFFNDPVAGRTETDLQNFRSLFLNTNMSASALLPSGTGNALINGISMRSSPVWDSIDSNAQTNAMVYKSHVQTEMRDLITQRINALGLAASLSVENVLDRATTQTCGGCHLQSDGVPLTRDTVNGPRWPRSLGFVHVNESGARSTALDQVFLPHRRTVLENYINSQCDNPPLASARAPAAIDPTKTVGGSAVGAAN